MNTQKLLSYLRQCIKEYDMISEHDKIAVGVSGGKDSMTLLYGLQELKQFYPLPFELIAIHVDLGFTSLPNHSTFVAELDAVKQFCDSLQVPFYSVKTDIYSITFDERKEKNPCSLCAKMRKGALNKQALALGCNKIAYAHHKDDFIETSIMSLLFEGHYYCFPPVTKLDRTGLSVIRPMFFINEREISGFAHKMQFPIINNPCPADGVTKRQEVKEFIKQSSIQFPDIKKNLNAALIDYFHQNK